MSSSSSTDEGCGYLIGIILILWLVGEIIQAIVEGIKAVFLFVFLILKIALIGALVFGLLYGIYTFIKYIFKKIKEKRAERNRINTFNKYSASPRGKLDSEIKSLKAQMDNLENSIEKYNIEVSLEKLRLKNNTSNSTDNQKNEKELFENKLVFYSKTIKLIKKLLDDLENFRSLLLQNVDDNPIIENVENFKKYRYKFSNVIKDFIDGINRDTTNEKLDLDNSFFNLETKVKLEIKNFNQIKEDIIARINSDAKEEVFEENLDRLILKDRLKNIADPNQVDGSD